MNRSVNFDMPSRPLLQARLCYSRQDHTFSVFSVHLIYSPQQPIILGYPWLRRHNPHIDWSTGTILQWSSHCLICLIHGHLLPARLFYMFALDSQIDLPLLTLAWTSPVSPA